jgi:acetylornithine deacetylase/succinyl-diaminopimelate desuccinylase-like protein
MRGCIAKLENTINITVLEGSPKVSIVPSVASAQMDCRLLPGMTTEQWVQQVRKIIQDDSIAIEVFANFPSTESKFETPLKVAIERVVKQFYPTAGVVASVPTGFTDSVFSVSGASPAMGSCLFP